ncbi:putative kinase [Actinoplanes lutulentus]|uniref:AAA domain-containing protein n=1 Tax=Actinoplanes lutulentus TaxID=1287878 RepID=A0A327Z426_9ACTN|nr:AAA family ATPase [Actinoplanes lutulentus]MBB2946995.1 putative kinase [Actinoplanes lutulentus]RAK30497.1 AAA domain-containing protein [Actinoplanes lutulentus]
MGGISEGQPTLVVIRGNSGSGKTTTAREVRRRFGRGCALVEQDYLRRVILREHGGNPVAPAFITGTVRAALDAGYHVILEGILDAKSHGPLLRRLIAEHTGPSAVFYFDVSFDETVRRHHTRAEPIPVTADQMREWHQPRDLLGTDGEHVLEETTTFDEAVATILHLSGLAKAAALTPCPTRCPRCAAK